MSHKAWNKQQSHVQPAKHHGQDMNKNHHEEYSPQYEGCGYCRGRYGPRYYDAYGPYNIPRYIRRGWKDGMDSRKYGPYDGKFSDWCKPCEVFEQEQDHYPEKKIVYYKHPSKQHHNHPKAHNPSNYHHPKAHNPPNHHHPSAHSAHNAHNAHNAPNHHPSAHNSSNHQW